MDVFADLVRWVPAFAHHVLLSLVNSVNNPAEPVLVNFLNHGAWMANAMVEWGRISAQSDNLDVKTLAFQLLGVLASQSALLDSPAFVQAMNAIHQLRQQSDISRAQLDADPHVAQLMGRLQHDLNKLLDPTVVNVVADYFAEHSKEEEVRRKVANLLDQLYAGVETGFIPSHVESTRLFVCHALSWLSLATNALQKSQPHSALPSNSNSSSSSNSGSGASSSNDDGAVKSEENAEQKMEEDVAVSSMVSGETGSVEGPPSAMSIDSDIPSDSALALEHKLDDTKAKDAIQVIQVEDDRQQIRALLEASHSKLKRVREQMASIDAFQPWLPSLQLIEQRLAQIEQDSR
eukprot:TRINITY_DN3409_c0_g1_i1.p1 TRINITY_DN3409_c0_g1~~TRINITY_DN3409_c0_g1_i1.p1  ORF type:complete len:348 (-),score=63.98 TRINITY_DN3409_c0_g1_i1:275-1318(-)